MSFLVMPKTFIGRKVSPRPRLAGLVVASLVAGGLVSTVQAGPVSATPAVAAPAKAKAVSSQPGDEAAALVKARTSGKRVEVTSERTATETLWADPAGTLTLETSAAPIRTRTDDGAWTAIDTDLVGVDGRLEPEAVTGDLSVSATGSGPLATLKPNADTSLSLSFDAQVAAPVVEGDTAVYAVSDSLSLGVSATNSGFSARLRLDSAPASAPRYVFPLDLKGLTPSLTGGALTLTDDAGTVVARSAPLSMWDSSRDAAGDDRPGRQQGRDVRGHVHLEQGQRR